MVVFFYHHHSTWLRLRNDAIPLYAENSRRYYSCGVRFTEGAALSTKDDG